MLLSTSSLSYPRNTCVNSVSSTAILPPGSVPRSWGLVRDVSIVRVTRHPSRTTAHRGGRPRSTGEVCTRRRGTDHPQRVVRRLPDSAGSVECPCSTPHHAAPEVSFVRFALAIVAFIAAAVMIGFGIAQRTVLLEPDRVSLSAEIEGQAAYTVIEPDALGAHPGKQTLTVSGSDGVFVSYGRSSDVAAWLGDSPYVAVHYDAEAEELTSEVVADRAGRRRRFDGRRRPADRSGDRHRGRHGARRGPRRLPGRIRPVARRVHRRAQRHDHDRRARRHLGAARHRRHRTRSDRPRDRLAARQLDAVGRTAARRRRARLPRRHRTARLGLRAPPPFARPPSQPAQGSPRQAAERTEAAHAPTEPGRQRQRAPRRRSGEADRPPAAHRDPGVRTQRLLGGLLAELRPGRAGDRAGHRDRNADSDGGAACRRTGDGARRHRAADGAHHAQRRGVHDRGRRRARHGRDRRAVHRTGAGGSRGQLQDPHARCPSIPLRPRFRRPRSP